jgi:hypothetical protein
MGVFKVVWSTGEGDYWTATKAAYRFIANDRVDE